MGISSRKYPDEDAVRGYPQITDKRRADGLYSYYSVSYL